MVQSMKIDRIQKLSRDCAEILYGVNGFRHNWIWLYWNRAQINMGLLEYGTIQFYGIGIRHNSICNNGIGHKHYFGLCLIPSTWNELCLIPTYWVSCVPNSIHTIVPYSVGLSSVTPSKTPTAKTTVFTSTTPTIQTTSTTLTKPTYKKENWKNLDRQFYTRQFLKVGRVTVLGHKE